jgi:hypothetical protein
MADLSQYSMSVYEDPDTGKVMPQYFLAGAGRKIPVEQQGQLTPQNKEATAASVGAGATLTIATVNMDGYSDFGVSCIASASHNYALNVFCSPDGASKIGYFAMQINSTANQTKGGTGTAYANYIMVEIINNDAAAKTYDVWVRKMNR